MEPLKIRLSEFERNSLLGILAFASKTCEETPNLKKPNLTSGLIILAEFFPGFERRCVVVKNQKNPLFKIPISVAQVLHTRLQHNQGSQGAQWLLQNLDLALVNRSLRPATPKPIS